MNLSLSEEQMMIQDMACKFAESELAPVAAQLDEHANQPLFLENLAKLSELGFMGLNIKAEYGGVEAGSVAFSLAITEIAKACASTAVTTSVTNMVAEVIQAVGNEEQKQKYLVPKSQMVFLKDLGSNRSVYTEYGWKNTGTLFKSHLISYAIEFLREEIDQEVDDDGNVIKKTLGIERIPDPMLLKEMQQYYPGLNVDRLVAFSALVAFVKVQQANRGYAKRRESEKPLQKSENLYKLKSSPFRNLGRNKSTRTKKPRSGFKNLR